MTLIVIAFAILWEAVQRFQHPEPVQPLLMFFSAGVGIGVNLFIGFSLRREGDNLNVERLPCMSLGMWLLRLALL